MWSSAQETALQQQHTCPSIAGWWLKIKRHDDPCSIPYRQLQMCDLCVGGSLIVSVHASKVTAQFALQDNAGYIYQQTLVFASTSLHPAWVMN